MKTALLTIGITFWVVLFYSQAAAIDLTARDLRGFSYAKNILVYKDIKLPRPKPPAKGGIKTGAVFILGRYLPPPYEVTVDGVFVKINGVPCTYLKRLLETDEERARIHHAEIAGPIENRLFDLYQRTKLYEGEKAARKKLEEFLSEQTEFKTLGIETRAVEPEKIFVMKMKNHKTSETYEIRINIADSGRDIDYWIADCEKTNKQRAAGHNITECLGYEIVEEKVAGPKRVIVKLYHKDLGEFEVEVEGPDAKDNWIHRFGEKMLIDKTHELWEKYDYDESKVTKELTEFALKQPWVTSFKMVNKSNGPWYLNGEFSALDLSGWSKNYKHSTRAERDKAAHKYAEEFAAPEIRQSLRRNSVIFFCGFTEIHGKNQINLVESIQDILKSSESLTIRKELLCAYLNEKQITYGKSDSIIVANFLAALWNEFRVSK